MSIRERFRSQVRDEVKAVALTQLAGGGPPALSVNAIGRALGVSGPSLYRYFPSRDALLTELVLDAYSDLADALAPARSLADLARRWRAWACGQPHRYRLLFTEPVPGYDAHAEPIAVAAHALMRHVAGVLAEPLPRPPSALRGELERYARGAGVDAPAAVVRRAITVWSRLHGHISLEIDGNFAAMGLDADALFADEVASLTAPAPRRRPSARAG